MRHRTAHIALTAGLFVAYFGLMQWCTLAGSDLWTYQDQWDAPGWGLYWHVKNSLEYLLMFSAFGLLGRFVAFGQLFDKFVILLCQSWAVIAFIDLQIGGNLFTGQWWSWWDWCLILAGLAYALATYLVFWRNPPKSDPIEPGKVFLVTRPPRNWLEFIGTIAGIGRRGPVSYYFASPINHFSRIYGPRKDSGMFGLELAPSPPSNRIFIDTKFDQGKFHDVFNRKIQGKKWSWRNNCFWMHRAIEREMKKYPPDNQGIAPECKKNP